MPWCDHLPAGVDYAHYDFCVNAGPVQATRTLQRALGNVRVDGHMGEATAGACNAVDSDELIRDFIDWHRAFYRSLRLFPRYGRGWLARCDYVENAALEIAATGVAERNGLSDDVRRPASTRSRASDTAPPAVATPEIAGGLAVGGGLTEGLRGQLSR